ncbi:MAG: hypothetical protein ACRC1K_13140 [Planctomycetia bacterium]
MNRLTFADLARAAILSLAGFAGLTITSGCAIVQMRYSVFGFDTLETSSPERARLLSILLVAGVVIMTAATTWFVYWLVSTSRQPEKQPPPR